MIFLEPSNPKGFPLSSPKPLQHPWGSQGSSTLQAGGGSVGLPPIFYFVLIKMRSLPYGNALQHMLVKIKIFKVFRSKSGRLPARKWVSSYPLGHAHITVSQGSGLLLFTRKNLPLLAPQTQTWV